MANETKYDSFGYPIRESHAQDLKVDMVDVFGWDFDDNHNAVPVKTGEKNLTLEILSHVAETNLKPLLEKAVATGDVNFLNIRSRQYGDETIVPDNVIDLKNASDYAQQKASSFGIDLTDESVDSYIKSLVAKALEEKSKNYENSEVKTNGQ